MGIITTRLRWLGSGRTGARTLVCRAPKSGMCGRNADATLAKSAAAAHTVFSMASMLKTSI
jgi:hypothetical protein